MDDLKCGQYRYDGRVCRVFFFEQKPAYEIYQCDWSSDVCSSDLAGGAGTNPALKIGLNGRGRAIFHAGAAGLASFQDRKSVV